MSTLNERFIVDQNGRRVGVVLEIDDYCRILRDIEDLEAIRAFDAAKASNEEVIPLEQALSEIENDEFDDEPA